MTYIAPVDVGSVDEGRDSVHLLSNPWCVVTEGNWPGELKRVFARVSAMATNLSADRWQVWEIKVNIKDFRAYVGSVLGNFLEAKL